jgi:hypothetical protein
MKPIRRMRRFRLVAKHLHGWAVDRQGLSQLSAYALVDNGFSPGFLAAVDPALTRAWQDCPGGRFAKAATVTVRAANAAAIERPEGEAEGRS